MTLTNPYGMPNGAYAQGAQAGRTKVQKADPTAAAQAPPPTTATPAMGQIAPAPSPPVAPAPVDYTKQALASALGAEPVPQVTGRYNNGDSDDALLSQQMSSALPAFPQSTDLTNSLLQSLATRKALTT